ncbi:hypothetical protein sos41_32200 [Alphaproteobacteria bacterium SO-S41]|nr:hypothetical protein sos41_32200 [Alphaproteobacteria bacterium SO-S41]
MDLMVGPVEYVESIETAWDQEPPPAEVSLFRKHRRFAVQDEGRIYWTKPDFKEPTFLNLDEARRMFTRVF